MDKVHTQLMDFFRSQQSKTPLSINERSLQIFGNEKFLASSECKKILNKYHISMGAFNVYNTPEPFIYYTYPGYSKDALIIENKDTWYTMRKVLMETGKICGCKFKALIYGEGRKIQSSFEYINEEDTKDIHDIEYFYYFGDLDSSGIDILYKLKKNYPIYRIMPFEPAYEFLYSKKRNGRVKDLKLQIPISYEEVRILSFLGENAVNDIYTFCNHDYIVPQENLNYEELMNWDLFY